MEESADNCPVESSPTANAFATSIAPELKATEVLSLKKCAALGSDWFAVLQRLLFLAQRAAQLY
jgi:hypothetical protein